MASRLVIFIGWAKHYCRCLLCSRTQWRSPPTTVFGVQTSALMVNYVSMSTAPVVLGSKHTRQVVSNQTPRIDLCSDVVSQFNAAFTSLQRVQHTHITQQVQVGTRIRSVRVQVVHSLPYRHPCHNNLPLQPMNTHARRVQHLVMEMALKANSQNRLCVRMRSNLPPARMLPRMPRRVLSSVALRS